MEKTAGKGGRKWIKMKNGSSGLWNCRALPRQDCITVRINLIWNDRNVFGKILLVRESNGKWSLPGGWVDVDLSVKENTIKEVKEEAGLDVTADRIIAVQDREKHNLPVYAYKICKIFVQCTVTGGEFRENSETTESRYFGLEELPELAEEKNNREQIEMCFRAYHEEHWEPVFD